MIVGLVAQLATPVLIQSNPRPNSVYTYRMQFSIDAGEQGKLEADAFFEERPIRIEAGRIRWATKWTRVDAKGTREMAAAAPNLKQMIETPYEIMRKRSNWPLSITVSGYTIAWGKDQGTSDVTYSERPVRPGSTWKGFLDIGSVKTPTDYRFVGSGSFRGTSAWVIDATMTGPKVRMANPYRFWVAKDDGRTIYAKGEASVQEGGFSFNLTFKLEQTARFVLPALDTRR